MRTNPVIPLPSGRERGRRLSLAIAARRRLTGPGGHGRAWINGREVGGTDARFAHLAQSHD